MKKQKNTYKANKRENFVFARNLVIVLAVVALVAGMAALSSSDIFLRMVPAVTVGEKTLSVKEYGQCYENTYNWYKLTLTEAIGEASILPAFEDLEKTVRDQGTGETYAEFFRKLTIEKITELYVLYGAEFTPEMVPFQIDEYAEIKKASLEITDDRLAAYMAENADACDIFNYRYMTLKTESGDDASLESLRAQAKDIAGRVTSEEDFIAEARAYDQEKSAEDDATLTASSGDLLNPYYRDFLRNSSRKSGDICMVDMPTGAYVVYFVSREQNHETAETMLRDKAFEEWLIEVIPTADTHWGIRFSH